MTNDGRYLQHDVVCVGRGAGGGVEEPTVSGDSLVNSGVYKMSEREC